MAPVTFGATVSKYQVLKSRDTTQIDAAVPEGSHPSTLIEIGVAVESVGIGLIQLTVPRGRAITPTRTPSCASPTFSRVGISPV